tara:strand:- start:4753 stop:5481 length:729 start_codon:yes stop_codon:yes gene_type:complete
MSFTVIIPARYSSNRLPGKPLLDLQGKPMIQRVYDLAKKSKAEDVYIATDHNKIFDCCSSFGAKVLMTQNEHLSGTDRIAEAIEKLKIKPETVIVNLQGDEPFLSHLDINNLTSFFIHQRTFDLCTLYSDFTPSEDVKDRNLVKLWVDIENNVKEFSRDKDYLQNKKYFRALHLGIYVYKANFISKFVSWSQSERELSEKLEQLRAVDNNKKIGAIKSVSKNNLGIDTPDDLTKARKILLND